MTSHGTEKLFGWFGGGGPRGTAGFLGQLGFRPPLAMAILVGLAETSGLLFAAGLLTPLAALAIAVVMLNAIWTIHRQNGFFNGNGGIEFPLTIFSVAVARRRYRPGSVLDRQRHSSCGQLERRLVGRWCLAISAAVSFLTVTIGRRHERLSEVPAWER